MTNFINLKLKSQYIFMKNQNFIFLLQQKNHDQDIRDVQNIDPNT